MVTVKEVTRWLTDMILQCGRCLEIRPNIAMSWAVQRYVMDDIHELNRWIREMMTDCNIDINNHPDLFPDVNEFDIVRMFGAITEVIEIAEQEHNPNSVMLKILNAYVTVKVIFPEEEAT